MSNKFEMNDFADSGLWLIGLAIDVRSRAYCSYSGFAVGAALLASDGEAFVGCNVENASFGLTICAERNAATSAVAAGKTEWLELALALSGGGAPCGACLQFLAEFAPRLPVIIVDVDDDNAVQFTSVDSLLPGRFTLP
jgi:cytidine deaminase